MAPRFEAGTNIAMKVPPHEWDNTVAFYRDTLGFEELADLSTPGSNIAFRFGDKVLWVDKVETFSQAEIWLEVNPDDVEAAAAHLAAAGCPRRDEIEPLPPGFKGFWIANPAGIIHLACAEGE